MGLIASLTNLRKLDNINITEEDSRVLKEIKNDIISIITRSPKILGETLINNNSILNEILSINILDNGNYIKNLAEKVIDIMIENKIPFDRDTSHALALKGGFIDLAQKLVDHGANPIKAPETLKLEAPQVEAAQVVEKEEVNKIVEAIFSNDATDVTKLLAKKGLINYVDEEGVSLLHLTAAHFLAHPTKKALEVFKPLLLQLKNNPEVLKVATSKGLGGLKWSDIYVSNINREGNPDKKVESFFKYIEGAYLDMDKIPTGQAFKDTVRLMEVKKDFIGYVQREFESPNDNFYSSVHQIIKTEINDLSGLLQKGYEGVWG